MFSYDVFFRFSFFNSDYRGESLPGYFMDENDRLGSLYEYEYGFNVCDGAQSLSISRIFGLLSHTSIPHLKNNHLSGSMTNKTLF